MFIRTERRLIRALGALAALALSGCAALPVSYTTAPGATVAIPVWGESTTGMGGRWEIPVPFGVPGGPDRQRGDLRAIMCPYDPYKSVIDCVGNTTEQRFPTVRYVTRLYPDPASKVGIENTIDGTEQYPAYVPMSGQVLALVDIPVDLKSKFPACGSPPESCFTRLPYSIWIYRHLPDGSDDYYSFSGWPHDVQLVRGDGLPNPLSTIFQQNIDMTKFVPNPKVVFALDSASEGQVYAADLTIAIPSTVTVKDVIEEEHLGRHTIVFWRMQGGSLKVQLVSPKAEVKRIAVVFSAPVAPNPPVAASAFTVQPQVLYNSVGNQIGGNFQPVVIR